MKTSFRPLARALLFSALVFAVACDRDDSAREQAAAAAEVERGGTAIFAESADMSNPLPFYASTTLDGNLIDILFMNLVRAGWEDGRLVFQTADENPMALARSYEYVGPDSAALRFHLRSDARWSDGSPLTARDVVWTLETLKNPETASPRMGEVEHVDSVVAQNDSTVTVYFDRRYADMLAHLSSVYPMPQHVFAGTAPGALASHPAGTDPAGNLVVSGPFRIGEWSRGERVVLVPNPHFSPQPNLERVVIRIIPEEATRLVEFQTGNIDFMRPLAPEKMPELRAGMSAAHFEREHGRFIDYIAWNPEKFEPFADPEIRRALTLAIDVPSILQSLQMEDVAVPAGGAYPPVFEGLHDPQRMAPPAHDPERARQILESKGWRDADGDGILEKNGRPFRFTLSTNTGNQLRADVAQVVQQQLRQIGVDAQLQQQEFQTLFQRMLSRDYEAVLGSWQVPLSSSGDITPFWAADSPFNITGYQNPEVAELFAQAQAQPTPELARPYWQEAAVQIAQDQPYTWLYYRDMVSARNDRLRGMRVNTFGAFQNPWEWWIPRAEQRGATTAGE